jgi:hypothetical protein
MKCHESARKEKNGRRRNRDESIRCDRDILWKTSVLSSVQPYATPSGERNPHKYGVIRSIHSQAAQRHGGDAAIFLQPGNRNGVIKPVRF